MWDRIGFYLHLQGEAFERHGVGEGRGVGDGVELGRETHTPLTILLLNQKVCLRVQVLARNSIISPMGRKKAARICALR